MEGTFGPAGVYAQIIDHPSVTRLDKFILADVFISNEMNDHFTIGAVFTYIDQKSYGPICIDSDHLASATERLFLETHLIILR